jgi:hypothetical protein
MILSVVMLLMILTGTALASMCTMLLLVGLCRSATAGDRDVAALAADATFSRPARGAAGCPPLRAGADCGARPRTAPRPPVAHD